MKIKIMSLKDAKCIKRVQTHRIVYVRIWYTFRTSANWQRNGSLVQHMFKLKSNAGIQYAA